MYVIWNWCIILTGKNDKIPYMQYTLYFTRIVMAILMLCMLIIFTKNASICWRILTYYYVFIDKSTIDMTIFFLQFVNKAMEKMLDYADYGVFVYIVYGHCTGSRWKAAGNTFRGCADFVLKSCSCRAVAVRSLQAPHGNRTEYVRLPCRVCLEIVRWLRNHIPIWKRFRPSQDNRTTIMWSWWGWLLNALSRVLHRQRAATLQ